MTYPRADPAFAYGDAGDLRRLSLDAWRACGTAGG